MDPYSFHSKTLINLTSKYWHHKQTLSPPPPNSKHNFWEIRNRRFFKNQKTTQHKLESYPAVLRYYNRRVYRRARSRGRQGESCFGGASCALVENSNGVVRWNFVAIECCENIRGILISSLQQLCLDFFHELLLLLLFPEEKESASMDKHRVAQKQ